MKTTMTLLSVFKTYVDSVCCLESTEDEEYVATVREFPGLSGLGHSRKAALFVLGEAVLMALDVLRKEGQPYPEVLPPREEEQADSTIPILQTPLWSLTNEELWAVWTNAFGGTSLEDDTNIACMRAIADAAVVRYREAMLKEIAKVPLNTSEQNARFPVP